MPGTFKNLSSEFRPIGGAGNNLKNADLDAVPGSREFAVAEYQNIVYMDYLAVLIGLVLGPYGGYDPRINAQLTQEFSIADAGELRPEAETRPWRGCAAQPAERNWKLLRCRKLAFLTRDHFYE